MCPLSSSDASSSEAESPGEKVRASCASRAKSSIDAGSDGEVMSSGERRPWSGRVLVGVALAVLESLFWLEVMECRVGRFGVDFEYMPAGLEGGLCESPRLWGGIV